MLTSSQGNANSRHYATATRLPTCWIGLILPRSYATCRFIQNSGVVPNDCISGQASIFCPSARVYNFTQGLYHLRKANKRCCFYVFKDFCVEVRVPPKWEQLWHTGRSGELKRIPYLHFAPKRILWNWRIIIFAQPVINTRQVETELETNFAKAQFLCDQLIYSSLLREITGGLRNCNYSADEILVFLESE